MDGIEEVTLEETWAALADDPAAVLLDVRTMPEWQFVGLPDLASISKRVITASWTHYPGNPNPGFVDEVLRAGIEPDSPVYIICRSGARSRHAAAALMQNGFEKCFNVTEGFEGPINGDGHRGGGWKGTGLPWRQT